MKQWRGDPDPALNGGGPPHWVSEPTPANDAPPVLRFPITWVGDLKLKLDNDDLIKGIIPRRGFVLVYGPSGDGKTFLAIDLCYHIATATAWLGRLSRPQGLTIYVAAEAGSSAAKRFIALNAPAGITLGIITRGANLLHPGEVQALIGELKDAAIQAGLPIDLVVFDTYSRSMPGGDENGSTDPTTVIGAADRIRDETGATTLFVHHSGKDIERGARGHTALFAAADTVIQVFEKVAEVEKSRDGPTGGKFPFELKVINLGTDSDGDSITTCTVEYLDQVAPVKRRPLPPNATVAFTALQEALQEHGNRLPASTTIPVGVTGITLSMWREQFYLRFGADDQQAAKKAFQRARNDLLKHSSIQISDPYVWLTYN